LLVPQAALLLHLWLILAGTPAVQMLYPGSMCM